MSSTSFDLSRHGYRQPERSVRFGSLERTQLRLPLAIACAVAVASALTSAASADTASKVRSAVDQILAQPYQPDYAPQGYDTAFGNANVLNTAPAQDYTSGSIPGTPTRPPGRVVPSCPVHVCGRRAAARPARDPRRQRAGRGRGARLQHARLRVGVRWAAMLYANGTTFLAADQRDFSFENDAKLGYPAWQQTFGWKESEDVVAAGRYLAAQRGTKDIGLVGYSEGGQNTVLALALDGGNCSRRGSSSAARPTRTRRSTPAGTGRLRDPALHVSGDGRARATRRATV